MRPAVRVPEHEPFCRRRLDRPARRLVEQQPDPVCVLLANANGKERRRHAPHLVPEETFGFYFEIHKPAFGPDPDVKDLPPRVLVAHPGKVREVVLAEELLCGGAHCLWILWRLGIIVPVRARPGIVPGVEGLIDFSGGRAPEIERELLVDGTPCTVRVQRGECNDLPAGMHPAIGPPGRAETCSPPVGKKIEAPARGDELAFDRAAGLLLLGAIEPGTEVRDPECKPHRTRNRRVSRLSFLHVLFSDWRV